MANVCLHSKAMARVMTNELGKNVGSNKIRHILFEALCVILSNEESTLVGVQRTIETDAKYRKAIETVVKITGGSQLIQKPRFVNHLEN